MTVRRTIWLAVVLAFASACSSSSNNGGDQGAAPGGKKPPVGDKPPVGADAGTDAAKPPPPPVRAPELGTGDHSVDSVVLTEIAGPDAKLNVPRDLAFNNLRPDELWVPSFADNSMVIITDASKDSRTSERRHDVAANHFMDKTTAIAFGGEETTFGSVGTFATCGESRNEHDPRSPDFMGPVLWTSDLEVFAKKNPFGLGSHIDMLHESPLCMGIAHESANIYYTLSGKSKSIVKYDYHGDHGIGADDHSAGEVWDFGLNMISYVPGVPSHLAFNAADSMLYIADTGNKRIAKLDTKSGSERIRLRAREPLKDYTRFTDAVIADVVTADSKLLEAPAGLKIKDQYMYVSDNANGRISAFTLAGERVNWIETGLPAGSLGGITFGPDGKLYFVDMVGSRVLRIDAKVQPKK